LLLKFVVEAKVKQETRPIPPKDQALFRFQIGTNKFNSKFADEGLKRKKKKEKRKKIVISIIFQKKRKKNGLIYT
jgi:hypothetical protein